MKSKVDHWEQGGRGVGGPGVNITLLYFYVYLKKNFFQSRFHAKSWQIASKSADGYKSQNVSEEDGQSLSIEVNIIFG